MPAQGNAWDSVSTIPFSTKDAALIPHVALVDFNVMPQAEFGKLILKGHPSMMRLLILDVFPNLWNVRFTH
jgi:hypothetical protein